MQEGFLKAEVTHQYGKRKFRFSFSPKTACVVLQGSSGVGKTTFLRILAGLEPKAHGVITFKNKRWLDSARKECVPAWKREVGWVPQDALCFPHLSVKRNLIFSGRSTDEETADMAKALGIYHLLERRVRNLSGGERHRVSLGRALLAKPQLLLLDEPFSSLDKPLRLKLMRFVKEFCDERSTPLILVSHDDVDFSEETLVLGELPSWELSALGNPMGQPQPL